ncbi:hypothetical protein CN507_07695 [Bacillus cereus]|nr:hypothetical protein CN507_07695 [Bacillus cereus]
MEITNKHGIPSSLFTLGAYPILSHTSPLLSFSTVQHRFETSYIKKSLNPTIPVDPLASLDIFGQQRFSIQEPHLTETI